MGFDDGQIIFDRENETYYPGQTVYGKLVFNQTSVKTFRSIYLKTKGYCKIHWTTSHTRRVNDRTEHYTKNHDSFEEYYNQTVYLIGTKNGNCTLQAGRHEFPFQCYIPPHCPSSMEHPNGFIRYEFKFIVDRPYKFDQEKIKTITVIAQKDLNTEPYCKEPIEFSFHESYCCWCMSAGLCDIEVFLPQSGFCPGQSVPITVNCANKSNVEIDTITFQLKEDKTFTAASEPDRRTENKVLAKLVKGPVPENTTRNWTIDMEVPIMDLYHVESCNFVDIDHEFEVAVATSGCHEDTSASRRVVIGHIPLREFDNDAPVIVNPVTTPLQHLPTVTHPFPGANAPYISPTYPSDNPPYPGINPPYPGVNQPFPSVNPPYPGVNPPYPVVSQPYSGQNPPLPGNSYPNSPFQGSNSPYPDGNASVNPLYTGGNPPVPDVNPPFSPAVPPYPGLNPPYHVVTPYHNAVQQSSAPSDNPIGFTTPSRDGNNGPYQTNSGTAFVTPTAPVPSTPGSESTPLVDKQPAFNPEFKEEK